MKDNVSKKSGMTLVEITVVLAVLLILISITIVVFPSVQKTARSNQAQSNASSVEKIASSFAENTGRYPGTTSDFTSGVKLPTSITLLTLSSTLNDVNGLVSVDYDIVGSASAASGARIRYWDYKKSGSGGVADTVIYIGNATSGSTFLNLSS